MSGAKLSLVNRRVEGGRAEVTRLSTNCYLFTHSPRDLKTATKARREEPHLESHLLAAGAGRMGSSSLGTH